jgi:FMNH2-dependent dimethyl sulfone monooxygenase
MQFGIYAPIPMATVGSAEIALSASEALNPLPPGGIDAQFDHGLSLLKAAEAVGFDLALFAERHLGNDLAAWILASAVAPQLQRIHALVASHPGLMDPVMTAKLAVSLDRICKGRMSLNIVNGWFDEEFKMFGGTVLQGEDRYRRSIEFIEILRRLWTEEKITYHGQHYRLDDAQLLLKPATSSPPRIYSVSTSDRGRDFIAENCDWWFIDMAKSAQTTDEMLRSIEASINDMTRRTARVGRKVHYAINPFLALAESTEAALEVTTRRIFKYDPNPDDLKIKQRMLPATRAGCMGSAKFVLQQVRRFRDMGVELMLLKLIPTVENVERIGAEIIAPMHTGSGRRRAQLVSAVGPEAESYRRMLVTVGVRRQRFEHLA